jgi:multimeric flavodoxin WrbA
MKVVAFNGSPRKGGNTQQMIEEVFKELHEAGIETELVQVGGKLVRGCTACVACKKNQDNRCILNDDPMNEWIQKMIEADGIILASPTYFADMTPELKALIDRAGYVGLANGGLFKHKVGAAVVAVRRAGAVHVFDSINHFFFIEQMIVPGSSYWNLGIGRDKGEVQADEEGMATMSNLGKNMAFVLKKLNV